MQKIEEKSLLVDGFKISYTDIGSEGGRILFCVHGLLSNGRDYDFLAQYLAERGLRVISMDLPGRGKSDWFKDKSHYSLPHYIPYCLALISHVTDGKSFDWFGVSLGGMIGMALHNFEGLKMERLILVDIGAEIPSAALDEIAKLAKAPTHYQAREEAGAFLKRRCTSWGITQQKIWEHLMLHNLSMRDDGTYDLHFDPAIGAALPENNETLQFWELWDQIGQPLLLVRGGKSRVLPEEIAAQMHARYRGERMDTLVFEDCGHVPNLMQVDQVTIVADWLLSL